MLYIAAGLPDMLDGFVAVHSVMNKATGVMLFLPLPGVSFPGKYEFPHVQMPLRNTFPELCLKSSGHGWKEWTDGREDSGKRGMRRYEKKSSSQRRLMRWQELFSIALYSLL